MLDVYRIPGAPKATVAWMVLSRKGDQLLASCQDRIMRLFKALPMAKTSCQPLSPEQLAERLQAAGPAAAAKGGSLLYGDQGMLALPGGAYQFQNAAERSEWVAACFSHDSEHVLGASKGDSHSLYIWSR